MNKFHIFVEGKADRKFLFDYLDYIESEFNVSLGATFNSEGGIKTLDCINDIGGWTKLSSDEGQTFHKKMKENTANGITNLIIFDADTQATKGGGFTDRKEELEKLKTKKGIDFELFLFPNNKDDGALEDLLEKIINPVNKPIFDCWESFENCLQQTSCVNNTLTIPAKKSKIYTYLEALHGKSKIEKDKIKDRNRDFKNTNHWDLSSEALNPLKEFLHDNLRLVP